MPVSSFKWKPHIREGGLYIETGTWFFHWHPSGNISSTLSTLLIQQALLKLSKWVDVAQKDLISVHTEYIKTLL